jgi:hypothetical protein
MNELIELTADELDMVSGGATSSAGAVAGSVNSLGVVVNDGIAVIAPGTTFSGGGLTVTAFTQNASIGIGV